MTGADTALLAVAIAVPVGVAGLLLIAGAIALGVVICWKLKKRESAKGSDIVKMSDIKKTTQ